MSSECKKCKTVLILCAADFPHQEEYWICPKCGYRISKIQEEVSGIVEKNFERKRKGFKDER